MGALVAVLADLMQKSEASAVLKMASIISTAFRIGFSPVYAVLLLMALAVVLSFVFEAETGKKSFYVGASILSIVMLMTPYQAPPSLSTTPQAGRLPPTAPTAFEWPWGTPIALAAPTGVSHTVPLTVSLRTADGKPIPQATVTLENADTHAVVGQSVFTKSQFTVYEAPGPYTLTIAVEGYRVEERQLSLAQQPTSVSVTLTPTWVPVTFQRMLRGVWK
ncbi:MAG TPA: carboxypeptidase-like regulatory domain-containing protein [Gemmatimonadales bacterium]|nr:carboxypeptidase-like regulatory domain-containing protein [Gemmatimonadales bacterium]